MAKRTKTPEEIDQEVERLNVLGVGLGNQGKYDEAIKNFKKAIKLKTNITSVFSLGLAYQMNGDLANAEKYYTESTKINPDFSMAYNNLGAIYIEGKDPEKAIKYFEKAIKKDPENAYAYNNIANAYLSMGNTKKAISYYKKAFKINPEYVDPLNNLGLIYLEQEKNKQALGYFEKILKIDPGHAPSYFHSGLLQERLGLYDKAVISLTKYLGFNPVDINTHQLLAKVYVEQEDYENAKKTYNKALKINPKSPAIYNDLGNLYERGGELEKAKKVYNKAVKLNPNISVGFNNLGIVYYKQANYKKAINNLEKAIELNPNYIEAYYHLALIYEREHELDLASTYAKYAIKIDPTFSHALGLYLIMIILKCDWKEYDYIAPKLDDLTKKELAEGKRPGETPFENVIRNPNPKENYEIARATSLNIQQRAEGISFPQSTTRNHKKIRLGYLSADFHDHATTHLISGMFEKHDRKKFEVFAYSYGKDDISDNRKRIIKAVDKFVDVRNMGDAQAAQQIYKENVDILIDLKGHTRNNRLEICASKPAPVQVTYLGFPGTTGADFIDYIITDKIVTPPSYSKYYSEKYVYLPHSYQVNDDKQKISIMRYPLDEFGLPKDKFIFSSFNQNYKIDRITFDTWAKILNKAPNSVLWLLSSNAYSVTNIKQAAKSVGIDTKRIIFSSKLEKSLHLARIRLSGLGLDPLTCGGHTTTSDVLWAGVPVVTFQGSHFASRVSSSLLTAVGLPELVTKTNSEYVKLAVNLANNPKRLEKITKKLKENRLKKPLFDTKGFTKDIEKAYGIMWDRYKKGEKPSVIRLK